MGYVFVLFVEGGGGWGWGQSGEPHNVTFGGVNLAALRLGPFYFPFIAPPLVQLPPAWASVRLGLT